MGSKETVNINGMHYDARTGMPLGDANSPVEPVAPKATVAHATVHATSIHASQQKSKTLNRRIVKKHAKAKPAASPVRRSMDITASPRKRAVVPQSSSISRFAKNQVAAANVPEVKDIQPVRHPLEQKIEEKKTHTPSQLHKSASHDPVDPHTTKQQAIARAMEKTNTKKYAKKSLKNRFPRLISVSSASLAVLLIAGYLTYLNMPSISIRVAAVQSGIDASYPGYHPTGYRLSGPIAWNDGSVSMRFAANAGPQNFTISEQKSSWDSSAVLENYVQPRVGSDYIPQTQNGLTVYTFENSAAWVNGGILYTIEGDAPLSNDQILRIATSL